ncbi:MAG TPA: carboxypeptidase regulatory-like domain-containing protein [Vicinamibacterales bacterium]|nr:carboxypeptidase regulatory-like domain-containing protein [Vicinamibacterales bacterium]
MNRIVGQLIVIGAIVAGFATIASGQAVQGTGVGSTLRVTVLDQTEAALIIAQVTVVGANGVEQTAPVDDRGVAVFENLNPGTYQVKAAAESFRPLATPFNVRRGENRTTLRLALASIEQSVVVEDQSAADRRDNGFTQTLSQDQIDALPDDPDEMAEELMRMAGPGAQIFVNGFRGGRLPPKDQIQQIRFHTNSFSSEYHEAGMVRVEVITKPGMGGWRGMTNFGFRDESLNAKNHFADTKGAEQMRRYMLNFSGPIAKGKTSLSVSFDGNSSYDSRTINAVSPSGAPVTALAETPTDAMNFNARVEHLLGGTSQLQLEYSRRQNDRTNIGVGDFDLPERAYATDNSTDTFRARQTGVINKKVFSEFRFSLINSMLSTTSASSAPTIRVNEAFNAGGAGQVGDRRAREIEIAQNFDFSIGRKHSMRAGVLLEAGWWDSNTRSNAFGTYTFTSLAAYQAGLPATYTIRTGDPVVDYHQVKAGWFIQDDFRPAKTLQMSVGVRQEIQTQVSSRWNFAPRAAFTWNATKTTTVRGGYGIFYDWFDSSLYEQTIRVDGTRQVDVVVQNPSFPVTDVSGTRLPASVIRSASLDQPIIQQASIGLEKPLTGWADFRTDYMWTRGSNALRSVNVNAPVNGVRPDPTVGNITEIQSSGKRASDRVSVSLNARYAPRRILGMVTYQYSNSRNFADFPTALPSNSLDPDADWGPSAQDVRHRVFFNFNAPLGNGVRVSMNVQGSSALPYTITTGLDGNGDTVFNDRPEGVGRNSARGSAQWSTNMRINKSIGLGGARSGPPNMPMPPPPPTGGAMNQRVGGGGMGPGGGGGDGPQMVVMEANNQKYQLNLFLNIQNAFNNVNYNAYVGNQLSSFFGMPTSAQAPRRVEVGFSLGF